MTTHTIRPMEERDLMHLQKVVEETGLFPAEMLPEMYLESFGGETPPLWMTLVVDGAPVAMSYSVQEAFAEGIELELGEQAFDGVIVTFVDFEFRESDFGGDVEDDFH